MQNCSSKYNQGPMPIVPTRSDMTSSLTADVVERTQQPELYDQVCRYLTRRYAEEHQASLRDFFPLYLAWLSAARAPVATVGINRASTGALFLEQYLPHPLEHYVSAAYQTQAARSSIVEIGNLAADGGLARLLFLSVVKTLHVQNIGWVAFTATQQVAAGMRRLGLQPIKIADADPTQLSDSASDWGAYYNAKPAVYIGLVAAGVEQLLASPITARAYAAAEAFPALSGRG